MTPSSRRPVSVLALSVLATAAVAVCVLPRQANGLTVFDPANYAQNLVQALRALDAVNTQIRQLQTQADMLLRMDRHLQSLPGTVAPDLSRVLSEIAAQVTNGEAIALEVAETEAGFARLFARTSQDPLSGDDRVAQARARWEEAHASLQRAALVQGRMVESAAADGRILNQILARSQGSVGALQAAQAGNELNALHVKQALHMQTLLATQARAETVDRSRAVAAQDEARQQFKVFMGDGRAYTRR